jgi:geranylgeranyl diphosphate synthase type I
VGEAFQLQDDLLGMFGDAGTVGKPVGSDLKEGKFTFLIYHALAAASPAERRLLESSLGDPRLDAHGVDDARRVIEETGARAAVDAMVGKRLAAAGAALRTVSGPDLEPAGRLFLEGLLDYLREREQ